MNENTWFKKVACTSVAANIILVLIVLTAIIFLLPVYAAVVRDVHAVSNALYPHVGMYNMHCFFEEY